MACENYEDCMQKGAYTVPGLSLGVARNGMAFSETYTKETAYLKAIAYKLDEISKKLDNRPNKGFSINGKNVTREEYYKTGGK